MGVVALRKELNEIKESFKERISGLAGDDNPQTKEIRVRLENQLEIVVDVIKYINGDKVGLSFHKL